MKLYEPEEAEAHQTAAVVPCYFSCQAKRKREILVGESMGLAFEDLQCLEKCLLEEHLKVENREAEKGQGGEQGGDGKFGIRERYSESFSQDEEEFKPVHLGDFNLSHVQALRGPDSRKTKWGNSINVGSPLCFFSFLPLKFKPCGF